MSRSLVSVCGSCETRYPSVLMRCPECGNTARKLRSDDPAMTLLDKVPRTPATIHRDGCYICEDDEFARLGLPLCYSCQFCKGHVPADVSTCNDCGKDQHP